MLLARGVRGGGVGAGGKGAARRERFVTLDATARLRRSMWNRDASAPLREAGWSSAGLMGTDGLARPEGAAEQKGTRQHAKEANHS